MRDAPGVDLRAADHISQQLAVIEYAEDEDDEDEGENEGWRKAQTYQAKTIISSSILKS